MFYQLCHFGKPSTNLTQLRAQSVSELLCYMLMLNYFFNLILYSVHTYPLTFTVNMAVSVWRHW